MTQNRISALVVLDESGALAGIIADRDIVRVLAENAAGALAMTVGACMTKNVATCKQSDTVAEIMETMTSCRFGHMPVIDKGRVAGIVSNSDVVKTRMAETMREAQALKEYIATTEDAQPPRKPH
jgi:CBS domain-containing protein